MQVIASPHPGRAYATLADQGGRRRQGAMHKATKCWFTLPLALEGLKQLNHILNVNHVQLKLSRPFTLRQYSIREPFFCITNHPTKPPAPCQEGGMPGMPNPLVAAIVPNACRLQLQFVQNSHRKNPYRKTTSLESKQKHMEMSNVATSGIGFHDICLQMFAI